MLGAEITTYLAAQGYGTVNTDLFYNIVPADPDTMVAVLQYGGRQDEPDLGGASHGTTTRIEFPRFQVVTRGARDDSNSPELKAVNIRATLVAVLNQTLSGVRYISINCLGAPHFLERDENFRVLWVTNYEVWKAPSTS